MRTQTKPGGQFLFSWAAEVTFPSMAQRRATVKGMLTPTANRVARSLRNITITA